MPSEYKSCKRKRRFNRRVIAEKQLNRGMKAGHYSEDYHVYECRFCNGGYHIGKDKFYYQERAEEEEFFEKLNGGTA